MISRLPTIGGDRRPASPQSVTRVIGILEALCASPRPLGLAELARALDTPKSSLAALLRGLADEGFIMASEGSYRLGPGAFGLGSALTEARRRLLSSDLIRDGMRRLAERSGETVLFAVRAAGSDGGADGGGDMLTYVDVIESRNSVRFAVAIGDRRPLYCTAGGRALLAAGTADDARRYLARVKPERLAAGTETAKTTIEAAIETARARGVAQTVDQASDGVTGTAAVICDAAGTALGALIVAAPSARLHDRLDGLARLVAEEATAISRSLGWRR